MSRQYWRMPQVHRKEREEEIFVQQEPVGCGGDGAGDFGAETGECLHAGQAIDPHTEID